MTGNGKNITFTYNENGIRTTKTVDGVTTKYHLIGNSVAFESNGTDNIYYTYGDGNNLVSMNLGGTEYYYVRNVQGDIIGLLNSDKVQVASYTYDSWGKLISIKDENGNDVTNDTTHVGYKNPYRYRGYRYDNETELYYLNSRYYNPELCRMLNVDAIVGSVGELLSNNMFLYCKNSPITFKDQDGFRPIYAMDLSKETVEERDASFAAMKRTSQNNLSKTITYASLDLKGRVSVKITDSLIRYN